MTRQPIGRRCLARFARTAIAALCYAAFSLIPVEAAMPQTHPDLSLKWEYPAGRTAERFLMVRLDKAEKEGGGFLGIGRSPSMADALDDARLWTGTVTEGDVIGSQVHIRVPGTDVPEAGQGDQVALGIVEKTICICVRKAPPNLNAAEMRTWFAGQTCAR
jgi:hypothetical protein